MDDKNLILKLAEFEKLNITDFDDHDNLWCGLHGEFVIEDGFKKTTVVEDDPAWYYRNPYDSNPNWVFDPIALDEQAYKLIKKYEIGFRMGQYANARVWFTQCKGDAQWGWCTNDADLNKAVVLAVIHYFENKS